MEGYECCQETGGDGTVTIWCVNNAQHMAHNMTNISSSSTSC
jgi:hypothetical protein